MWYKASIDQSVLKLQFLIADSDKVDFIAKCLREMLAPKLVEMVHSNHVPVDPANLQAILTKE